MPGGNDGLGKKQVDGLNLHWDKLGLCKGPEDMEGRRVYVTGERYGRRLDNPSSTRLPSGPNCCRL